MRRSLLHSERFWNGLNKPLLRATLVTAESHNPYATPAANVIEPVAAQADDKPLFYAVSARKFWVLSIATFGLYDLAWFYWQWRTHAEAKGFPVLAPLRAVFSIFYVFPLFLRIKQAAKELDIDTGFQAIAMAVMYAIVLLLGVATAFPPFSETLWLSVAAMFVSFASFIPLFIAQQVANSIVGDPHGDSNDRFTPVNVFWIVLGIFMWVSITYDYYLLFGYEFSSIEG